jgi:hypothetical protein
MATTVDTILVKVEADLRDVKRSLAQLERDTKKTTQNVSTSMNRIGTVVQAVIGGIVVRQFARGALAATNFASDVEEMQAKSSVVFGQFTGDVRKELESFGEAVGRSRFELEGMAAQVQDTFVPLGFARGEAAQLSVQLTKLATDVASFQNASDASVMEAFQSALVGNHETVRRFGIVITETELKAELFRMGITKNIDAVSAQEKVQARLNLILAGTRDAQGDAARTSESYANRTRALGAAIDELQFAIGQKLMPTMKELLNALIDLTNDTKEYVEGNRSLAEVLVGALAPQYKHLINNNVRVRKHIKASTEATKENTDTNLQNAESTKKQNEALVLTKIEGGKLAEALRKLQIEQDALNAVKQSGFDIDGEIIKARRTISDTNAAELDQIDAIMRANEALRIEIENQTIVMDTVQDATKRFGDSLSNNLADGLANGKLALDDFKNIARDFVSQLISEFIRLAVVNQIINSIFGLTGQAALPTASFGGGGGGATNTMRPMPRPSAATGGTVQPRMPTLVGERGPEIFIPNGGRVMNSNDTRSVLSGGGSVVVNQTLNVSTGVQDTVRAELVNFLPVVQAQTVAAVAQAKQRGGKLASML